ncbi:hypothetical protein M514_01309 [Trichuris suis]|uniref:Uncharacterized protein n=1 Tax=Trichuris suis TaxID=68888 RepID=A0A085NS34_9BILA|nr:hypothetical protein M513_01309 [Trichuris suis]KFD72280.1 hypothetical protein M514_01309 [Trichuris suis]
MFIFELSVFPVGNALFRDLAKKYLTPAVERDETGRNRLIGSVLLESEGYTYLPTESDELKGRDDAENGEPA